MEITTSKRLEGVGEYYFSQKLREIELMNQNGPAVINLGIGSPDLPPHPEVIAALAEVAARPDTHAYQSYKGAPVLRMAIAQWYRNSYQVTLDPATEVLPLLGSKEGILHTCMTYLNKGDKALVPDPGYPTYRSAVQLAGGTVVPYKLTKKNDYEPDWDRLEKSDLKKVKLFLVNYPHMPTGKKPSRELLEKIVAFASKHDLLVVFDNPYSFILNTEPLSILSVPGAKEVCLELNSLSKSHNMAGWRVGMLCGMAARINEILRFKTNMDSGMFLPVQLAAAKALSLSADWYQQVNTVYGGRRKKVYELLRVLGCKFSKDQAGLFVWASAPANFNGESFSKHEYGRGGWLSDKILNKARVFITPGGIFGKEGMSYVRVSLCAAEDVLQKAIDKLNQLKSIHQ